MGLKSARADVMKLIEDQKTITMGLNNQIASLPARFEKATSKALDGEEFVPSDRF